MAAVGNAEKNNEMELNVLVRCTESMPTALSQ